MFAAIGLLSIAAALWLTPSGLTALGLDPVPVVSHCSTVGSSKPLAVGSAGTSSSVDDLASALPLAGTASGAGAERAVEESALSVAACPLGMVFVAAARACIDRYEYPNLAQALPATLVSFDEAKKACDTEGKRLCTDKEWTLACLDVPQGTTEQEAYGAGRCNYGAVSAAAGGSVESGRQPDEEGSAALLGEPRNVAATLAMLDKRTKSGRMADCVSSGGALDLLGNVQEWVQSGNPSYEAAQKGGYFASEAASCSDSSNVRHHQSRHPGSGFRCCAAPLLRRRLLPGEHKVPVP